jgi:HEAT repeat protein
MPTGVAGPSHRVKLVVTAMLLLLAGTPIVAVLYASMSIAIGRATDNLPVPPPPPSDRARKTGIENMPCTEENIAGLIKQVLRRPGFLPDLRIPAAKKLGDCGAAIAVPALEKMSQHEDSKIRFAALEAIAKIKKSN